MRYTYELIEKAPHGGATLKRSDGKLCEVSRAVYEANRARIVGRFCRTVESLQGIARNLRWERRDALAREAHTIARLVPLDLPRARRGGAMPKNWQYTTPLDLLTTQLVHCPEFACLPAKLQRRIMRLIEHL